MPEPLAAKRGGVQFLVRGDDNLALIDAAGGSRQEGDSIIADDEKRMGSPVQAAASPLVTPTPALLGHQSHSFLDNAIALFGHLRLLIAQPRTEQQKSCIHEKEKERIAHRQTIVGLVPGYIRASPRSRRLGPKRCRRTRSSQPYHLDRPAPRMINKTKV